jgi:hypothetical protein
MTCEVSPPLAQKEADVIWPGSRLYYGWVLVVVQGIVTFEAPGVRPACGRHQHLKRVSCHSSPEGG